MRLSLRHSIVLCFAVLLCACGPTAESQSAPSSPNGGRRLAKATFAGGCFWCMEGPFDKLPGVVSTTSGYTGGRVNDPSYEQVSAGTTGHTEAMQILYDPSKVTYSQLVDLFWRNIDPLDGGGQFCDRGEQYRSGIFYHDEEQRKVAEQSKAALKLKGTIATGIVAASTFWPAEEYHQNYYQKNPIRYRYYRAGCGRDRRLEDLWGPAKAR